jgi:hypothetical protein
VTGQARKYPKLEKMGSNLMETVPDGVRAFLFMQVSENLPLKELWRSGDQDKGTGGDGKRVLGICTKRHRSVLIHDAEKDTQMRGIKFRSFLSALCVPVFDKNKSFIGALLLIADGVDAFSNEHKFAVERSARDYGPTLSGMQIVTNPVKKEEPGNAALLFTPAALFATAFAFMLLIIWVAAPPAMEPPPPKKAAAQTVSHNALITADQFLMRLKAEKYDQAWQSLHSSLRSKWSQEEFERAFSSWVEEGNNKEILSQRSISKVQRSSYSAKVLLFESPVEGDNERWNWELEADGSNWGVHKLDGPVQSP